MYPRQQTPMDRREQNRYDRHGRPRRPEALRLDHGNLGPEINTNDRVMLFYERLRRRESLDKIAAQRDPMALIWGPRLGLWPNWQDPRGPPQIRLPLPDVPRHGPLGVQVTEPERRPQWDQGPDPIHAQRQPVYGFPAQQPQSSRRQPQWVRALALYHAQQHLVHDIPRPRRARRPRRPRTGSQLQSSQVRRDALDVGMTGQAPVPLASSSGPPHISSQVQGPSRTGGDDQASDRQDPSLRDSFSGVDGVSRATNGMRQYGESYYGATDFLFHRNMSAMLATPRGVLSIPLHLDEGQFELERPWREGQLYEEDGPWLIGDAPIINLSAMDHVVAADHHGVSVMPREVTIRTGSVA